MSITAYPIANYSYYLLLFKFKRSNCYQFAVPITWLYSCLKVPHLIGSYEVGRKGGFDRIFLNISMKG